MRFLPASLNALLVELDDLPQTLALHASLMADPIRGVDELVPAARTLLVHFRPAVIARSELAALIGARRLQAPAESAAARVEIAVHYDGEDLAEVAGLLGLSRDELVLRHTGSDYTCAFTGFAPGFAYLSGGHASLNVPRRNSPRTRIPAGAVALAGGFSAVYPQASPGGWQIIGRTSAPMWDLAREVPALLQPGCRVRFVDVTGKAASAEDVEPAPAAAASAAAQQQPSRAAARHDGPGLEIRSTGLQALFQDTGRHGLASQGVSASGAMDKGALRAANRLVGNAVDAACIELVYGGFECVCHGDAVVAFTGAQAPITLVTAGGVRHEVPGHAAIALCDGDRITLGQPSAGIRCYLAVRGGFEVDPVLGSCATDTLARIGPPPILAGDVLGIRPVTRGAVVGMPMLPADELPTLQHTVMLDVVMGPRTDWFTPEAVEQFLGQTWRVTPQSDRVGLRLQGDTPLTRAKTDELPSEGTVLGAIQVPPNGQPVLFMADHPLTGGYPVVASVAPYHLDRAGQIPIGANLRFNLIQAFDPT